MQIFPYTLVRFGGISFEKLKALELKEELFGKIEEWLRLKKSEQSLRKKLQEDLTTIIRTSKNYPLKVRLKQLRANIYNERKIKKPIAFIHEIQELQQLIDQQKNLQKQLEPIFEKCLLEIRTNFQELTKNENLLKGILLSSPALLQRSKKYQSKPPAQFKKKEGQTERGLLKFLTRATTKTTPFSTFTQLGVLPSVKETGGSHLRLNNYLFKHFKAILAQKKPFYQQLNLNLNPTLSLKNQTSYHFLTNNDNIETFQELEKDGVITLIHEIFLNTPNLTFERLINLLQDFVAAEKEDLTHYIYQLINVGFLEFDFKISGVDTNWNQKLADKIDGFKNLPQSILDFAKLLRKLNEIGATYAKSDVNKRIILLRTAHQSLAEASEKLGASGFDFKPKDIFYEDVALSKNRLQTLAPTIEIEGYLKILHGLLQNVQHFRGGEREMDEMTHFFVQHFGEKKVVELYDFYENYYRFHKKTKQEAIEKGKEIPLLPLQEEKKTLQQNWVNTLSKLVQTDKQKTIHLTISQLQKVNQSLQLPTPSLKKHSFGAFFQFCGDQAVLNNNTIGYGKMYSRFLHIFPTVITNTLRKHNQPSDNELFAEISDASYFNANLHPPLFSSEIKIPGGHHTLPNNQQIPITKIEVIFDKKNQQLALQHQATKQRIYIFDMGFQAHEGRSKLFQLLSHFGKTPSFSLHFIQRAINQQQKANHQDIICHPRIVVENRLIIQRKTWWIPKTSLPTNRKKNETALAYYLRVLEWKTSLELPNQVFITLQAKELNPKKEGTTDHYKPQYLDFKNPLLVQLFEKSIPKVGQYLKVVEFLPSEKQLPTVEGKSFVGEFFLMTV